MDKTYVLKGKPKNDWLLIDADQKPLGRFATKIAEYLMGKHKPTFTPGVDMGDYVIIINAGKLKIDEKRLDTKKYHSVSGFPGGIRTVGLREQLEKHPDRVIRHAVWGMLPHNKLGREILGRLKIFTGSDHPHAAQNPKLIE